MTPVAILLNAMRGRRPRPAAPREVCPPATRPTRLTPSVVPPYVRRATIYSLAAQGLSCDEIVRRTGFAYDAVAMLVAADVPAPEVRP
jgi:hypothetical protein